MSIIGIVEKKEVQNKSAADKAQASMGEALAELFVKFVQGQATSLKLYLNDIVKLSHEGRIGFRVSLNAHVKAINAHVKAKKGMPEHDTFKRAKNSACVRISEAITFSKAIDAGMSYDPNTSDSYHAHIGTARVFLEASSTTGPTVKRGRKATPTLDKVRAYLAKAGLDADDFEKVKDICDELAAGKEDALL